MNNLQKALKKLDELINFYDPSQARDESGKWSGSGGGSNFPEKSSEKVSSEINDKLNSFIEENNDDLTEDRHYTIDDFMKSAEGWVGQNLPNKYSKESVLKGVGKTKKAIAEAMARYGGMHDTGGLGAKFMKLYKEIDDLGKKLK